MSSQYRGLQASRAQTAPLIEMFRRHDRQWVMPRPMKSAQYPAIAAADQRGGEGVARAHQGCCRRRWRVRRYQALARETSRQAQYLGGMGSNTAPPNVMVLKNAAARAPQAYGCGGQMQAISSMTCAVNIRTPGFPDASKWNCGRHRRLVERRCQPRCRYNNLNGIGGHYAHRRLRISRINNDQRRCFCSSAAGGASTPPLMHRRRIAI